MRVERNRDAEREIAKVRRRLELVYKEVETL